MRNLISGLGSITRSLTTASMLAYYILPNTYLEHLSIIKPWIIWSKLTSDSLLMWLSSALIILPMVILCKRLLSKDSDTPHLIFGLLTFAIISTYIITAWFTIVANPNFGRDIILTSLDIAIGMLAAIIAPGLRKALIIFTALTVLQSLFAMNDFFAGRNTMHSGTVARAEGTIGQTMEYSRLLVIGLSLTTGFLLFSRTRNALILPLTATITLFLALLSTMMRGSLIAVTVSTIWIALRAGHARIIPILAFTLLLLSAYVAYHRTAGPTQNRTSAERSAFGRFGLWSQGWFIFSKQPISGVGVGMIDIPITVPGTSEIYQRYHQPKNLLLFFLDEYGVAGFVIAAVLTLSLYAIAKNCYTAETISVIAAWISMGISGIWDTPFGIHSDFTSNCSVGFLIACTILSSRGRNCKGTHLECVESHSISDAKP